MAEKKQIGNSITFSKSVINVFLENTLIMIITTNVNVLQNNFGPPPSHTEENY